MFIYAQNKPKLFNIDKISELELAGRVIVAIVDGKREVLGTYFNQKRAQMAFDDLVIWLNTCRRVDENGGIENSVYRLMTDTIAMKAAKDEGVPSMKKILVDAGLNVYEAE